MHFLSIYLVIKIYLSVFTTLSIYPSPLCPCFDYTSYGDYRCNVEYLVHFRFVETTWLLNTQLITYVTSDQAENEEIIKSNQRVFETKTY